LFLFLFFFFFFFFLVSKLDCGHLYVRSLYNAIQFQNSRIVHGSSFNDMRHTASMILLMSMLSISAPETCSLQMIHWPTQCFCPDHFSAQLTHPSALLARPNKLSYCSSPHCGKTLFSSSFSKVYFSNFSVTLAQNGSTKHVHRFAK